MSVQIDWIPSVDDFAARLVLVRHEMRWNLKEAAEKCAVSAQSWREWELYNRKPRDYESVCRRIAEQTGCNLIWLMTGIRQTPPDPGRPDGVLLLPRMDSNHQPPDCISAAELPAQQYIPGRDAA